MLQICNNYCYFRLKMGEQQDQTNIVMETLVTTEPSAIPEVVTEETEVEPVVDVIQQATSQEGTVTEETEVEPVVDVIQQATVQEATVIEDTDLDAVTEIIRPPPDFLDVSSETSKTVTLYTH